MNELNKAVQNHGIIIENRSKISITGVLDVISFDEQTVLLDTSMGELTIKGENLKVMGFTHETGNISVEGTLFALGYTSTSKKKSMKSRLFG